MVALRHRDATGEGQWIDSALYESAFRIMEYSTTLYGRQGMVRQRGLRQHAAWPGGACQTKDGHWVAYTAPAQHLFERLCTLLGQPDLPRDPRYTEPDERTRNMPAFAKQIEAWFAARTFEEVAEAFEAHQVPYSMIMSMADIFTDAHYKAREMIVDVPEPTLGSLPQPAVVPKLSRTPGRLAHAGPGIGVHTDELLTELLNLSAEEIAALRQEGAI
jgi:crotonobetainyl-CoA:carnitine CoA-transferase CaiB-like acyl-CoA transferase